MAFTKLTKDMNIIQKLEDEPNDVGGMTGAELKAKFDEGNNAMKDWINNVFLPEAEEALRGARLESLPPHGFTHAVGGVDPLTPAMMGAVGLGDKPAGAYTGNGSAEPRSIAVGGTGNVTVVRSTHGIVLITEYGGQFFSLSSVQSGPIPAYFANGTLTVISDSSYLNAVGATYSYQVL